MTESLVFKERAIVSHSEQEILSIVRDVILEVMDEDEDEITILMDTSFQDDLELESIELIAMGDLLGTQFGPSLLTTCSSLSAAIFWGSPRRASFWTTESEIQPRRGQMTPSRSKSPYVPTTVAGMVPSLSS